MSHDRKFLDTFALIIAALVLFSIAMLVLSKLIGGKTQGAFIAEDPAVVGQVEERISPVGQVAIAGLPAPQEAARPAAAAEAPVTIATVGVAAGETAQTAVTEVAQAAESAVSEVAGAVEVVAAQADADPGTVVAVVTASEEGPSGEKVYNGACTVCHSAGIAGAPKVGVADVWTPRVAKGMDALYANAINGYVGDAGVMPAKGGRVDLSDDEVRAAVDYMVNQSR